MQGPLSFARWVAFGLALVVLAVLALLFAYEKSGVLADRVRHELGARLGDGTTPISIGAARLRWFDARLELDDLRIGDVVAFERLEADFDVFAPQGPALRAARAAGGRVTLGARLGALARGAPSPEPGTDDRPKILPELELSGVALEYETTTGTRVPLGRVDARAAVRDALARPAYDLEGLLRVAADDDPRRALHLQARATDPERYEFVAWSDDLAFGPEAVPSLAASETLAELAPRGSLKLVARCVFDVAAVRPVRGYVRASLADGTVDAPGGLRSITGVDGELELHCAPRDGEAWTQPAAWRGALSASAKFGDARARLFTELGGAAGTDHYAKGFVELRSADVVLADLAAFHMPVEALHALEAYGVGGRADAFLGIEWRANHEVSFALECETRGEGRVDFVGFANEHGERRGFSWPIEGASGRALVLYEPRIVHRTHVAIVGANGRGRDGASHVACEGIARTHAHGDHRVDYDFALVGGDVPVDDTLRRGVASASGADAIWQRFAPRGGTVAVRGRIQHREADPGSASTFEVELRDVGATWSELPVPCDALRGSLVLAFDTRGISATSFDLVGRPVSSDGATIRGRWQDDPAVADRIAAERAIEALEIRVDNLALKGTQRDAIVERFPGVGGVLDEFGASGRVDVALHATLAQAGGARRFDFEITPRLVQLAPRAFQVQTRNVRGRVLVGVREVPPTTPTGSPGADVTTSVAPLVGDWSGATRVAFQAVFPPRGPAELALAGAGLNLENRALVGAFRQATTDERGGGLDLEALSLEGRIDFRGALSLPDDRSPAKTRYEVYLRENDFQIGGGMSFGLQRLSGSLVQSEGKLSGDALSARIGRTPVALRNARFEQRDGEYVLAAEPEAFGLPLDREHMRFFLDDDTLKALEEQLRWRGAIDIYDAQLTLRGRSASESTVRFSGSVVPHGMFVDIGLPLQIDEARAKIRELVLEHGTVRAWAEIDGLSGRIADRELERARMLVTYVEPHLSILDLDGRLEGGRIAALGSGDQANGAAFAIDLSEPYAFELGLELDRVQVAGLLRGLFESDFANSGELSGDLRLAGQLDRILGIQGRGRVDIVDSRLWSIPVVRDLFAQLGYDKPAVFRRVRSRFEVADGRIDMQSLYVESPLAQLVGTGSLDLDGRLAHDLEVKYAFVDNLGPVTRFLYWVQNNLLRVEVRGDMSRPKILLRGMLSFLQGSKSTRRDLPVPAFTPIPERF